MDVQVKAGSLVRTIADTEISSLIGKVLSSLRTELAAVIQNFLSAGISAAGMFSLENRLAVCVREAARKILQWIVSKLEPPIEKLPGTVKQKGQSFRRMPDKTKWSNVVTFFGNIQLSRARYRRGRAGKAIFPLELLLGVEEGFTPAAANTIGKQFATSGSSQGRSFRCIGWKREAAQAHCSAG